MFFNQNKKADSLMVSFVILVAIVLAGAMAAYAGLKYYPNMIKEEIDCKDGTSLIVDKYECSDGTLKITFRNNGLFGIKGFKMYASDDINREPTKVLRTLTEESSDNYWFGNRDDTGDFLKPLTDENENVRELIFETGEEEIKLIKIQPFIFQDSQQIVCQNAIIKQEINC